MPPISKATDFDLDRLSEHAAQELDSDLALTETTSDQEAGDLTNDLEQALSTPEAFLEPDFAELPDEINQQIDGLSQLATESALSLRDADGLSLTTATTGMSLPLRRALTQSQLTLRRRVEAEDAELESFAREMTAISTEAHSDANELRQACAELEKLLAEDPSAIPAEAKAAVEELKALTSELSGDIDTELDTGELRVSVASLSTDIEMSLTQSDIGLGGPVYIGETYTGELPTVPNWRFPKENQPYVGIIDSGFSANSPDIDYSKLLLGYDYVGRDRNPLLGANEAGEADEHGTHLLGLIAAIQDNDLGVQGINDQARLWLSRATGSGQWAEALIEFVNTTQAQGRQNAIANLSFDLVQTNADGSRSTRYHLTPREREALAYARQHGVLVVAAAGNEAGVISALGQASRDFDNLLTVGAVEDVDQQLQTQRPGSTLRKAEYSSVGMGLGLVARGGGEDSPVISTMGKGLGMMAGTSVATARVSGAASLVWAANPRLTHQQVIAILTQTATDLEAPGWDPETGAGLLNLRAAVKVAAGTNPSSSSARLSRLTLTPQPYRFKVNGNVERSQFFKRAAKALKRAGEKIVKGIKKVGSGAKKVAKKVASGVKKAVKTVGSSVKKAAKKLAEKVVEPLRKATRTAGRLIRRLGSGIKKVARRTWSGVKRVSRQLWYKLQGIYHRAIRWITQLPPRLKRLALQLWEGVKSLKPWSLTWWKSLGEARTWKAFGKWLGELLIYSLETFGVGELYETAADFIKFNTRPLTARERGVISSVFGSAINLNLVRVDQRAVLGPSWTDRAYVSFNTINAWGPLENDLLLHEMTHVWQYQTDGAIYMPQAIHAQNSPDAGAGSGYDYGGAQALKDRRQQNRGFTSFNREQQGDIIRDYYRLRETLKGTSEAKALRWEPDAKCEHLDDYIHFVKQASSLSDRQLRDGIVCEPAPTPQPPAPKTFVASDRNEAAAVNSKDFRQLSVTVNGDQVNVAIATYARPAFNSAQSLYFRGGTRGQVHIRLSSSRFTALGAAPNQPGFFNVPLQSGVTRTSGNTYSFAFSWSKVFGTQTAVEAWLYSQDSKDRIPDGRGTLKVNR